MLCCAVLSRFSRVQLCNPMDFTLHFMPHFHQEVFPQTTICLIVCCCSVAKLCLTLCNPWTVAHQPPLSMGFSRQEYWSGLPFPSPEDFPHPGMEPAFPALIGGFFTTESPLCIWQLQHEGREGQHTDITSFQVATLWRSGYHTPTE